jgi:hypothetical protein
VSTHVGGVCDHRQLPAQVMRHIACAGRASVTSSYTPIHRIARGAEKKMSVCDQALAKEMTTTEHQAENLRRLRVVDAVGVAVVFFGSSLGLWLGAGLGAGFAVAAAIAIVLLIALIRACVQWIGIHGVFTSPLVKSHTLLNVSGEHESIADVNRAVGVTPDVALL